MFSHRNNSDTLIIVLHEIYGFNDHIAGLCKDLSEAGYDVICPDLLDGKPTFGYEQIEEAYLYFMNFIGLEAAAKLVTFLLRQEEASYKRIFLMGASVGATVAWMCCGDSARQDDEFQGGASLAKCTGAICLYGSRIRDFMEIAPKCPVLLLFAETEEGFDPRELKEELKTKEHTETYILEGKHGFADPYSVNYSAASALEAKMIVRGFLARIR